MRNRLSHRQLIHTPLHRRRSPSQRKHLTSSGISIPSRPNTQKKKKRAKKGNTSRRSIKALRSRVRHAFYYLRKDFVPPHTQECRAHPKTRCSPRPKQPPSKSFDCPVSHPPRESPFRVPFVTHVLFSEPTKSIELPGTPIPSQYTLPKQVHQ